MSYSLASKDSNAKLHKLFPTVPADDHFINHNTCCWWQRESLIRGHLCISEHHICFVAYHSSLQKLSISIPICEIATLEMTGDEPIDIQNIQLRVSTTDQRKHTFKHFHGKPPFDLIYNIWISVRPENAIVVFHSTMLANLQLSVYCALTTFEPGISQWTQPSEWLNANVNHIRATFDGIVDLTGNKTITFPATMIFQRWIVSILAYNMLRPGNETLSAELNAILKKYQDWDLLNQIRSQANIKNQLLTIFRNASPRRLERLSEDLLNKLLFLDSIALSANVEALITDEDTYEELVETTGAGAQSLTNLLHARLDFPMDSGHKRLLVRALTRLSETSRLYPESLTLNNVTPEHGRRATGGFADVYKGRCFDEDIAIKVFRMPLPSNVNSLNSWGSFGDHFQTLIREFITWRQLSHPNVLPFYGVHFLKDTLETRFCLVSPWMENGNVVEFLARRNHTDPYRDTTNSVCLALDIAQGIRYLHGENIIHRDLKGYNVLVSPSMRCYIADFGLATLTDSGSGTTLPTDGVMGTPKWLAPEQDP